MKVYRFEGGAIDWVIAENEDDAREVMLEQYGRGIDWTGIDGPVEVPGNAFLTIDLDPGRHTRTINQWLAEFPRGLLCSSEY